MKQSGRASAVKVHLVSLHPLQLTRESNVVERIDILIRPPGLVFEPSGCLARRLYLPDDFHSDRRSL